MAATTAQKIQLNNPLQAVTMGVHGSPFFLLNSAATTSNNVSVEDWQTPANMHAISVGSGEARFLDVYLASYLPTGSIGTIPSIRAYGSTPNMGASGGLDVDKAIQGYVSATIPDLPASETASNAKLFPLTPYNYANDSTTTEVAFPTVSDVALYSGTSNDIRLYPPVTFNLNGATTVYVAITTAMSALTAGDFAFLLGRFTS